MSNDRLAVHELRDGADILPEPGAQEAPNATTESRPEPLDATEDMPATLTTGPGYLCLMSTHLIARPGPLHRSDLENSVKNRQQFCEIEY